MVASPTIPPHSSTLVARAPAPAPALATKVVSRGSSKGVVASTSAEDDDATFAVAKLAVAKLAFTNGIDDDSTLAFSKSDDDDESTLALAKTVKSRVDDPSLGLATAVDDASTLARPRASTPRVKAHVSTPSPPRTGDARHGAPRYVGSYILSSAIAFGGMASIHLGALRASGTPVFAMKRPHPHLLNDEQHRRMLVDEANIASRIRHENVVTTHGLQELDNDLMIVMDYVAGLPLADLMPQGSPLSPTLAVTIIAGVLRGLHAAHEATSAEGEPLAIVHRDVSPQNIHVGVDGVARVLDFGIAKAAYRMQTTQAGTFKGKLAYMSPEQVMGRPVDRRADVYGAAAVLWEALAGRLLFAGSNDGHIVSMILCGCSTPPSAYVPGLPRELDAIVMRGLSVRPEDRFGTALEMAEALEATLAAPPPRARIGEWVEERGAAALQRQRELIAKIERARDASSAPAREREAKREPSPPLDATRVKVPSPSRVAATHRIRGERLAVRDAGSPARVVLHALTTLLLVVGVVSGIVAVGLPGGRAANGSLFDRIDRSSAPSSAEVDSRAAHAVALASHSVAPRDAVVERLTDVPNAPSP